MVAVILWYSGTHGSDEQEEANRLWDLHHRLYRAQSSVYSVLSLYENRQKLDSGTIEDE